jgi:hypothetical protein
MAADYKWTTDDLEAVRCAITEIVAGKRLVTLQLGEHTTQYQATRLSELLDLRDRISAELNAAVTTQSGRRPRVYRTQFAKGL